MNMHITFYLGQRLCEKRNESIRGQLDGTIPSTDAGQRADSSALIDASDITVSAMGSMGGGNGGEGGGGFGGGGFPQGGGRGDGENPSAPGGDDGGDRGRPTPPDGGFGRGGGGGMPAFSGGDMPQPPGGEGGDEPGGGYDLRTWLWTGGCTVLLLAAIVFAAKYRRK